MGNNDELKKSLTDIHSFKDEHLYALIDKARNKVLKKGDYLLQPGKRCDFMAFIRTGSLRYYTWTDTDELTLHFFTEHSWVTDNESLISQTPSKNHMQAMETTEVEVISLNNLHQLLEQYPEFRNLMKVLDKSVITSSHLKSITSTTPDERYQLLLEQHPDWVNRFPQMHIASYLGMTKETFSRVKARVK